MAEDRICARDFYISLSSDPAQNVNVALVEAFTRIAQLDGATIHLLLHSNGNLGLNGPSEPAALYHTLRAMPVRLVTYNMGTVASGAILLYLAGEERVCLPASRFLFHGSAAQMPTMPLSQRGTLLYARHLREALATIEAANDVTATILNDRCTLDPAELADLLGDIAPRTPEWALAHGLAHRIGQPQMPTGAQVLVVRSQKAVPTPEKTP